jgi:hypothetical protein
MKIFERFFKTSKSSSTEEHGEITGFIRVETEDGIGLFHNDLNVSDAGMYYERLLERHNNFPIPHLDDAISGIFNTDYQCGYKSIEQMKEWIRPLEMNAFINCGLRVYAMKATGVHSSEYQVIFKYENVVEKTDITDLFVL